MQNAEHYYNNFIQSPLKNLEDHTYVDGWVHVYLEDLKKNSKSNTIHRKGAPKFPVVASHCLDDQFIGWSLSKFQIRRVVVVSGAIDIRDKLTIDSRLQTLYRTCINAIIKNMKADPNYIRDAAKFSLNNSKFSIPDSSLEYAMFELTITIQTQEDAEQWES